MSTPTCENVLAALGQGGDTGLSIRQIAQALSYQTNTPWAIVFIVQDLKRDGLVVEERRRPYRVRLTAAGQAAR